MRHVIAFPLTILAISVIQEANATCTTLDAPSCALTGSFSSAADWDRCRLQMLDYKSGMEARAACVRDEGGDEQGAYQEFENTLAEFNRRSRELPAQPEPELPLEESEPWKKK